MFQFACPSCRSRLLVPRDAVGKVARCPRCQAHNRVPAPPPADEFVEPEPGSPSAPGSESEAALIRACRARIGPPPRALGAAEAEACRLTLRPGLEAQFRKANDPLLRILADQDALLARGTVVWGQLVQANEILFDPNNERTAPANVIYSPDPFFDGRVGVLAAFARDLFAQKGKLPGGHALRAFVEAVTDEYLRVMRRELPRGYCGGRAVYFTTCLIQPGHLPGNHIARSEFPLMVNFAETEAVMVLPARFWPPELVARWRPRPARSSGPPRTEPQTDDTTRPAEERERGDLAGVPAVYRHHTCEAATRMPEEVIRSYLKNPYLYGADQAFCGGCGKHVPLRECVWTETGEDLQSYTDRLRAAKPELKPGGVPKDPAEAARWHRRAAERGDAAAMHSLGYAYAHGEGVPVDLAEALRWYRQAAELGNAAAMNNLGFAYEHGKGVAVDLVEAVRWYRRAAERGDVKAMSNLGSVLVNGRGVPADRAEALEWLRRAADQGSAAAMCSLGLAHARGEGGSKDHAAAVRWYRQAAALGNVAAMTNLGFAYQYGEGVPVDFAEALKWYRQAAALGSASAMYNVGILYEHGRGVARNLTEALKWYQMAAEKNHPNAQSAWAELRRASGA